MEIENSCDGISNTLNYGIQNNHNDIKQGLPDMHEAPYVPENPSNNTEHIQSEIRSFPNEENNVQINPYSISYQPQNHSQETYESVNIGPDSKAEIPIANDQNLLNDDNFQNDSKPQMLSNFNHQQNDFMHFSGADKNFMPVSNSYPQPNQNAQFHPPNLVSTQPENIQNFSPTPLNFPTPEPNNLMQQPISINGPGMPLEFPMSSPMNNFMPNFPMVPLMPPNSFNPSLQLPNMPAMGVPMFPPIIPGMPLNPFANASNNFQSENNVNKYDHIDFSKDVWLNAISDDNKTYYVEIRSRKTQWEKPKDVTNPILDHKEFEGIRNAYSKWQAISQNSKYENNAI